MGRFFSELTDAPGLFMWLVVLPLILGLVALLHYGFGLDPSPFGN